MVTDSGSNVNNSFFEQRHKTSVLWRFLDDVTLGFPWCTQHKKILMSGHYLRHAASSNARHDLCRDGRRPSPARPALAGPTLRAPTQVSASTWANTLAHGPPRAATLGCLKHGNEVVHVREVGEDGALELSRPAAGATGRAAGS